MLPVALIPMSRTPETSWTVVLVRRGTAGRHGTIELVRRLLTGCVVTLTAALAMNVGAASAADLLVLNGDPPVTLSGSVQYGLVYVDGELRLTGDTQINAASIYIGPDASIDTCYVPGSGDGQCTAGRSLTLVSAGPLTVAPAISLESGVAGPGGNLGLSGTSVAVGGQIDTGGHTGFGSGSVTITSTGPVATQGISAPGAGVSISGKGPVLVGGAIQTQGSHAANPGNPTSPMQPGGPVAITATGGEVDVDGAITTQGQSGASGGGSGGAGGAVAINGANVHAESITTFGGNGQASGSGPGISGPVNIGSSGALAVSGTIDTSGAAGPGGTGAPSAPVSLKAGGAVALGAIDASGGQTAAGSPITVSGTTTVAAGDLTASGGGGSAANRNGSGAGAISIAAPQGATLGALLAVGGSSAGTPGNPATPGAGGAITVASSAGSISVGRVESAGGSQGTGPGANGGPISLKAADDLSVAGDVRADGSDAGGSWTPPWPGGNAGSLFLGAGTGTLDIGGPASAQGGTGSGSSTSGQLGGSGGAGGQVTLIAHAIGLLTSLSAAGGSGGGNGDLQGPGGPGATITAYTDVQIFNSQRLVSADGGDGNPTGAAGNQVQDSSPASLASTASGTVSFRPHSPGASHYLIETVAKGATPKVVEKTSKTKGLHPVTPVCQTVKLEVVSISPAVGWTSDPSNVINYTRQPSKTQTCSAPAKLRLPSKLSATISAAQHGHWAETLRFHSAGIGAVNAKLRYATVAGRRATVTTKLVIVKAGTHVLHLTLPPAVRGAGSGSLVLTEISPNGRHRTTHTVRVEVTE
jgi:hypothetical protein